MIPDHVCNYLQRLMQQNLQRHEARASKEVKGQKLMFVDVHAPSYLITTLEG